jgi:hypothetical protein
MDKTRSQQLIAWVMIFALVIHFPLLSMANKAVLVAGVPLLYLWIFSCWLLLILGVARIVRRKASKDDAS